MARLKRFIGAMLLRALLVVVVALSAVNGSVRLLGHGDPFWLSPRFMSEKLSALGAYGRHIAFSRIGHCRGDHRRLVRDAARKHGIPVAFAMAVAQTESGFHSHRISSAGAMGVMQLMPGTAADLAVKDPFNPKQNIDGGIRYIKKMWRRYGGDRKRVAAAYNAGPGRVPRHSKPRLPAETKRYVRLVLARSR